MPAPALTHHEILELVAPFARRGRQVDLAASNRLERQIAFKPLHHPPADSAGPGLDEALRLDSFGTGTFRLVRTLTRPDGLQATLQALGPAPETLLDRVEAVPRERHFEAGPGYVMARSYGFESAGTPPLLTEGLVQLDGLRFTLQLSSVKGVSADLALVPAPGQPLNLPEDLLAVLGWDWARLVPGNLGWTSKLRLRGKQARRSRHAEAALLRAATHLVRVLAEPPAQFHQRHGLARWGVVFRRLIPTLTAVGLVAGAFALPRLAIDQAPGLWVALHYAPIGLLALAFTLQELPRFEIPPLPRRSRAAGWRGGAARPGPATESTPPEPTPPLPRNGEAG